MLHMIRRRWALGVVAGLALGAGLAGAGDSPPPIFTKSPALRLPVQLDERSRAEVSAVKLYVRGPDGRCECAQTAPPTQTAFDYRAPGDGEYQFTFVTVDRRGVASPANVEAAAPHRVVVVDTTAPDVTAQPVTHRGEKFLQCQVRDANPDWASLRVVYLTPDNIWKPLLPAAADTPNLFRVPTPGVFESKIEVTVADRAGNKTTRPIDLGDPTTSPALPSRPAVDRGRPDPAMLPRDGDLLAPATPAGPERGVTGAGLTDLPKAPRADVPPLPDLPPVLPPLKGGDPAPEIRLPMPDVPGGKMPDVSIPNDPYKGLDPVPGKAPAVRPPAARPPADPYKAPDLPPLPTTDGPGLRGPTDPPLPPRAGGTTAALKPSDPAPGLTDMPRTDRKPGLPTKATHPILNTRTCTINYQLEGSARVASRIDFWATPDNGRTWVQLRDASGGLPPARLTLPSDGTFGIRIRPGGGAKPPEPGEDPDCQVEVDTTRPIVSLLPPSVDEGTMTLSWTASDANLLSNAISLYYATRPDGPWEVIVAGYKNEGVYRWALPTGMTGPVYLRLEATDRAGNVGRAELPTPVALDAGKQRVKVLDVGPGR